MPKYIEPANDRLPLRGGPPVGGNLAAVEGGWAAHAESHCLWIATPPGHIHSRAFEEVALALQAAWRDRGGDLPIVGSSAEWGSRSPIVLGGHLLPACGIDRLPPGAIIYNFEDVSGRVPWIAPDSGYIEWLRAYATLDHSRRNIEALAARGVGHARLLEVGYHPVLTRLPRLPEKMRDIDVLFYGAINPRRASILNGLRMAGLKVMHLFGVYGADRDAAIARSKLVLNMHLYDQGAFEIVRVSYLFANRACVVTEGSLSDADIAPFADSVMAVPHDQLVGACRALLADPGYRTELAENAFKAFSARSQAAALDRLFGEGDIPAADGQPRRSSS